MWNCGTLGWCCAACPYRTGEMFAAIGHAVTHQYKVAPPKPIEERPRRMRR
jgi:hypothetical protein